MLMSLGNFMSRLGGGDEDILKQVPQERARFMQMAGVLLTTSGIAVISMTFALRDGVKAPLFWSVLLSLVWGVIILNLDRFLVLSMGSIRDRWRLVWISLPRFLLAVVLALVISTPLVLRIFASDISAQLVTMHLEASKQQAALEASSGPQQEANQVQKEINADQATLDGHLPEAITSPQLQSAQALVAKLQPEVNSARNTVITAYATWQCELYGDGANCADASNIPGPGPIAQAKEQVYDADLQAYDSLVGQLNAAQTAESNAEATLRQDQSARLSQYQAEARQNLPGLKTRYAQLEAYLQNQSTNATKANDENTGLLAQLQALSEASAQNSSLEAARFAVLALFFLIEILPVGIKFLLNLGPLSTYEVVAKSRDDEITDSAHVQRVEKRRRTEGESKTRTKKEEDAWAIEEGKSKARLKVEEDMRTREVDLGKHANEYVAGEMRKILDLALQQWSDQVQARLSSAGGTGSGAGGTGSGSPSGNGSAPPNPNVSQSFGLPSGGNL